MRRPGDGWTDERVELAKKLAADDMSAGQIAAELGGGLTRNAVIGKLHRLGLKTHAPKGRRGPYKPRGYKPRAPRDPSKPHHDPEVSAEALDQSRAEAADYVPPVEQRRTLLGLRDGVCRWPYGDPCVGEFFYCGGAPTHGPYCGPHTDLSYLPHRERRTTPDGRARNRFGFSGGHKLNHKESLWDEIH